MIGSVIQSDQGMASSLADGQSLICAPGEAVRHYKNGMLKCAPAEKVPDCTERTNLRKYGSGDMFFSYVTKVCLEQHRELVGGVSKESAQAAAQRARSQYAQNAGASSSSSSNSHEITLRGMTFTGGVGGRY